MALNASQTLPFGWRLRDCTAWIFNMARPEWAHVLKSSLVYQLVDKYGLIN